ncbi:MAG: hypothetical protein HIU92_05155 [Proteobacteria bacterium]|nr:hypothetical protein [Pseudomonadota bacterium]
MSTMTVGGASLTNNWTGTSGATAAFVSFFNKNTDATISLGGVSTVPGSVAIFSRNGSDIVSGSTITDQSTGHNSITSLHAATIFAAPGDTISSASASTVFGAGAHVVNFSISGAHSSIVGGAAGTVGTASGANTTLVGGTGISMFTATGDNSLAVAGRGITGLDLSGSTGAESVSTNPLGNSGTLVAFLGSGADTVMGGSGASTILGGSGHDVFAFISGHSGGSEVIVNFTARDSVAFSGYTAAPTETVKSFDGVASDVIKLSDNTTITLVAIDHKLFS